MVIRILCPLIYSMLVGVAWSLLFKKKFINSLAPAYMVHVILILFCGMIFRRLSLGIYGGIAIALIVFVLALRNELAINNIKVIIRKIWREGMAIFFIFYLFCFFTNYSVNVNEKVYSGGADKILDRHDVNFYNSVYVNACAGIKNFLMKRDRILQIIRKASKCVFNTNNH